MPDPNPNRLEPRVFLLTHIGNDARNAAEVLAKGGIDTRICAGVRDLCENADEQTGALIIGEEILNSEELAELLNFVTHQPAWSDIPIVLLTPAGDIKQKTYGILNFLGARANVTLLEKPLRAITLISVVKSALRSRGRQYEVRSLLQSYSRAVEDAQTASAKFKAVFEQSSVFAGIMSLEGIVTEANRLCLEVCGYRAEEVIGRAFWECPWWRGSREIQEKIRLGTIKAAQGVVYKDELRYLWADGTERTADFALHPIRDEAGEVIYLHPTGVDITETLQANARAEFLSQLTEKLSVVSDPEKINEIATREIGQFLGAHRCYFFQPQPDSRAMQILPDWRRTNEPGLAGTYLFAEFGQPEMWQAIRLGTVTIDDVGVHPWTRNFLANYRAVKIMAFNQAPFIHEGKCVACIAVSCDVPRHWTTDEQALLENAVARVWPLIERARAEEELRESNVRFEFVREVAQLGFWFCDLPFDVLTWDAQAREHFGVSMDEPVTMDTFYARLHPDDRERTRKAIADSIANRTRYELDYRTISPGGTEKWIRAIGRTFYDSTGQPQRFDGVTLDITERKRSEVALRNANALLADKASHLETLVQQRTAKLQETVGELEAFSYSIAHDMRAPLRSLQGFAKILLMDYGGKIDDEGQRFLHRIVKSADRMDKLIRDVLDYSQIVRTELTLEKVDVEQLLRGIMDTYPMLAPDKAEIVLKGPFPPVLGNEAILTQIFSNLMGNGVKFVRPDVKPRLLIWAEAQPEVVRLYIKDNGIGIASDQHEKIFGIFQRVDKSFEGTGIGLAIVKKAVERIGGKVGLSSELEKGSTFWIDVRPA